MNFFRLPTKESVWQTVVGWDKTRPETVSGDPNAENDPSDEAPVYPVSAAACLLLMPDYTLEIVVGPYAQWKVKVPRSNFFLAATNALTNRN